MRFPRKFTDEQIAKLRVEYSRGYKSSYQLSAEHQVTQATIVGIVQGSTYKSAGGPITWPGNQKPLAGFGDSRIIGRVRPRQIPRGHVPGRCRDVACANPIAASGWAQRMHLCEDCFRLNHGKKSGRVRRGQEHSATCRVCRSVFVYYKRPSARRRKYCGHACATVAANEARRVRPAHVTSEWLYEMYWGRGLTLVQVAALLNGVAHKDSIAWWMKNDGIPRRLAQRQRLSVCAVEGCGQPIHQQLNRNKNSHGCGFYGRLCLDHLRDRDRRRYQYYRAQLQEQHGRDLTNVVRRLLVGLPESVRADAEQEIIIAVLSGEVTEVSCETIKPYIVRVFRENADSWKFVSLAAPTRDGEDAQTWGERLGLS